MVRRQGRPHRYLKVPLAQDFPAYCRLAEFHRFKASVAPGARCNNGNGGRAEQDRRLQTAWGRVQNRGPGGRGSPSDRLG